MKEGISALVRMDTVSEDHPTFGVAIPFRLLAGVGRIVDVFVLPIRLNKVFLKITRGMPNRNRINPGDAGPLGVFFLL